MANEKTSDSEYILKPGHIHHGFKNGERHQYVGGEKGNDRVVLNERQAKAFADKFESVQDQKNRLAMQDELNTLRQQQEELNARLAESGMTLDDLINQATTKKPEPSPSTGSAEPKPANTTPAPTGSTSDPAAAAKPAEVKK